MTSWPLLIAVVACAMATVEAGCYPLTKSQESDTKYSTAIHKGRYPSGTKATLNCPGKGYTDGSSTYTCNGEYWMSTHASLCARDCTFDVVKGLHYSMVMVNGKPTKASISHRKSAELVCGKERHKYSCQDGHLFTLEGKSCKNCAVELATKLGYTNMTSTELSYGDALNGFYVQMWCREEQKTFLCRNSRFVSDVSHPESAATEMCGCPPVQKPESFVRHFTISSSPVDGNYNHGTTVTLSCVSGPVLGAKQIKCVSGKWDRPLGKCPRMCDIADLRFEGCFSVILARPKMRQATTLQIHGGLLLARCKPPLVAVGARNGFKILCENGKWSRQDVRCIPSGTNTKSL